MTDASNKDGDASASILKIAVLAVGGQGGGVLANWISNLATLGDYAVQMTSVAGVAQRTGATIYYIEMAPKEDRDAVFALTPTPGDVDIVIAAELMEAGRAVVRGFVSEDRTTLIASTHRILAVNEKQAPGDGRADSQLVLDEIRAAAHKSVCFDMETIATDAGSMISASLFGALAKSGATPFSSMLFEEIVRASGRGRDASLAAFSASLNFQESAESATPAPAITYSPRGPAHLLKRWEQLENQVNILPTPAQSMIRTALRKVVDYQDIDYGIEYLQHLAKFLPHDSAERSFGLTKLAAKYIANAMCYDDIIRVADLKTRSSRQTRLLYEQQASADQVVHVTEYFHPRAQEICGTLPTALGTWFEQHATAFNMLDRLVNKGRRIRSDSMTGFLMMWIASALKPVRRKLLRHRYEMAHLNALIQNSLEATEQSVELAIEMLQCQRLVKGYSDTHARGHSKYRKIMDAITQRDSNNDSADWLRQLRKAALVDENGHALDELLATGATH